MIVPGGPQSSQVPGGPRSPQPGRKVMMPGGPQQLRYSLEVMPSDPRRRVGVQLHVVCVPVATVVGFATVIGCRCCLPGWSCVLWEHWGVWIEKWSPVSACWRLGWHCGSAAAVIWSASLRWRVVRGLPTSLYPVQARYLWQLRQ